MSRHRVDLSHNHLTRQFMTNQTFQDEQCSIYKRHFNALDTWGESDGGKTQYFIQFDNDFDAIGCGMELQFNGETTDCKDVEGFKTVIITK